MHKSSIAPSAIQTLFDSAANAANKGQAQWFTPIEWARVLALPLNDYRPVIADLTCGNGQLLAGASRKSVLLGCEIEPLHQDGPFVTSDITRFYPLLCSVNWKGDTFVLNPPWDLHWYREPLSKLAESECPAVREAFTVHDGRTSRDTIDSTIATLCMALDRSSSFGEGLLIANEATLQRLLFAPNAPHRTLVSHIWAHLIIPGNICMNKAGTSEFQTGVIYFARGHTRGPQATHALPASSLETAMEILKEWEHQRYTLRFGPEAVSYLKTDDTETLWLAAGEEQLRINGCSRSPLFNIWLDTDTGTIRTYLNLFDTASGRVDKAGAAALHGLNGRQPIQLGRATKPTSGIAGCRRCRWPSARSWRTATGLEG